MCRGLNEEQERRREISFEESKVEPPRRRKKIFLGLERNAKGLGRGGGKFFHTFPRKAMEGRT